MKEMARRCTAPADEQKPRHAPDRRDDRERALGHRQDERLGRRADGRLCARRRSTWEAFKRAKETHETRVASRQS
jgi:hypothetical protein